MYYLEYWTDEGWEYFNQHNDLKTLKEDTCAIRMGRSWRIIQIIAENS